VVALDAMDEPLEITATIRPAHPECLTGSVGEVRLVYSTDGGENWETEIMHGVTDEDFVAELPAVDPGTQIRYRIEAEELETSSLMQRPVNPADPGYYLYVGELAPIFCLDFETTDQDWSHELLEGQTSEGADDWMVGTPGGNGGDPDHAYSGSNAWGNDLSLESNWDGQYQNDKINTLYSPVWNLAEHPEVRLQFRRWLGVEDSVYDYARIYVNDEVVWTNAAGSGDLQHVDYEWILFDLDITEHAGGVDEVQIRWEIESDGGLQFGGWTIDDVCLYEVIAGAPGDDDDDDADDDDAEADDDGGLTIGGGDCTCRHDSRAASPTMAVVLLLIGALIRRRR
jgi:MYXO-CTERM domain-containing protein